MSIRPDHKALLFLATIASLGAAVRAARAVNTSSKQQPALEHQMQAADSAKRAAGKRLDAGTKRSTSRGRAAGLPGPKSGAGRTHRDYRGRLDLDLASAAEIDSLPDIGPALAKRIVTDRMANGAFRELIALRRVKGMTPKLLVRLDSLVSFSGAYKPPQSSDTILAAKPRKSR